MNLLSLDTSSHDASIAVLKDDDVLLEYNFSSRNDLSAVLVPSLDFILKAQGLEMAQIDAFAVGIGPGLFTGVRIGMATVKGLAFAEQKPLLGVDALTALAYKLVDSDRNVIPLIDARKGEVYLGGYRFDGGEPVEILSPRLLKIADCVALLEKITDKVFIGSGAEKYRELLAAHFGSGRSPFRSNFLANEIGKIALRRFRGRRYPTELQALLPFYLRQPDAETNLVKTAGAVD